MTLPCFKAYDIRGRVPDELNEAIAYRTGEAFARRFTARKVAVGHDARHSSRPLLEALARGLTQGRADVIDIGLCGTEEIYFATLHAGLDGGIMVTASHNPADYNGMKLVQREARPVSGDSGLRELEQAVAESTAEPIGELHLTPQSYRADYVRHLLTYVKPAQLKPLKLVVNAGNGTAGLVVDALAPHLPFEFVRVHHEPDPDFPNGIPNPLLPENRSATAEAVREHSADFGIAWDGDFDRCFLFDEQGRFIEGYYIVGLLAEALLKRERGGAEKPRVIHDPRLTWNTVDIVQGAGGIPVQSKTGHAFIKERMRLENAVYGGEMSAHHYFRDFGYCDNGMIPWLLVATLVSERNQPLSSMVDERMRRFPASGEINRKVGSIPEVLARIEGQFARNALAIDRIDGLSLEFADWRFNLRGSNTEPVLRLNVEARGDAGLMQARTAEILSLIDAS